MATQQKLDLALRGLFTSPNLLSGIPPGALEVADNIVINAKNLAESRRGQTQYGSPLSISSSQVHKIFNYASSLIVNYSNKMAYDSGSGTWVDYSGTYNAPSSEYKMRSLEALQNFYFTTDAGIYKIDSIAGTPRPSGSPKALGGEGSLNGGSGFLLNNSAVAYRIIWGYRDANSNLILGAPSQRLVVSNSSGGTRNISLTFPIPSTITTSFFYQIYRSTGTLTAADEPNDELQLVLQANVTAGQIAAKTFTVIDATPYSLMRATIYTAPSQEGIANSNYQPPFAYDMDVFKNCAFYANVKQKQILSLALISVDLPGLGYYVDATVGTTNGGTTLTAIASTAGLRVGMRCVGTGIPTNATIAEILTATTIRMSVAATATATVSVEFQDRFSIAGVDYWAGTAQNTATNTFLLSIASTPGTNINESAINLIRLINTSPSNTLVYAYYTSGIDDLPGQIQFEERSIGGATFSATSTAGSAFTPVLPATVAITGISVANPTVITAFAHGLTTGDNVTIYSSNSTPSVNGAQTVTVLTANTFTVPVHVTGSGSSGYFVVTSGIVSSSNEVKANRVYVSKTSQVEAVPIYSYFDIGAANFPIQRVVSLRDGIFFFKKDGIYRISGETFSSFTVTLIDNTVALKVPESAVPFNNQVFCFTTQGVVAVTDSGAQLKSVPIEDTLLELASDQFTNFTSASFGVAYESSRLYMFFTVTKETDAFATQAFVYNSLTDSWTRWDMSRTCGVVNTSINKLFMAQPDTGQILIERKSYTSADYADEQFNVTITGIDSKTVLTVASAANVVAGMTLVQGNRNAIVQSVNTGTNKLTFKDTGAFSIGAAIAYTPIVNRIKWAPIDCENPGLLKQISECTFIFKNAAFREITASFVTNISNGPVEVPILNKGSGGWGGFPWGQQPWGGVFGGANVLRTYVPREKQRCSWMGLTLTTDEAFTGFSLQGVSLLFKPMSSWVR